LERNAGGTSLSENRTSELKVAKMKNIIVVTNARYISDYTLELTFSDGVKAVIDFSGWIEKYPFFEPLKNTDYFKKFSLDGWTVVWPNGADIALETLHKIAVEKSHLQVS
jgi:Protein of unknown function (DUF2442)